MKYPRVRAWDRRSRRMSPPASFAAAVWGFHESFNVKKIDKSMAAGYLNGIVFMQYIGFDDMKRNQIFEQDVVSFKCHQCEFIHKGIVVFIDDLGCFGLKTSETDKVPLTFPMKNEKGNFVGCGLLDIQQVLGNVFENPELWP